LAAPSLTATIERNAGKHAMQYRFSQLPAMTVFYAFLKYCRRAAMVAAALFIAATIYSSQLLAAETITLGSDQWCPFVCFDGEQAGGLSVEKATAAFAHSNIQLKVIRMPWSRAMKNARYGVIDGVIGASRKEAAGFILPDYPVGKSESIFLKKKSSIFYLARRDRNILYRFWQRTHNRTIISPYLS